MKQGIIQECSNGYDVLIIGIICLLPFLFYFCVLLFYAKKASPNFQIIHELLMTFSVQESKLSSKKIERCMVTCSMLWICLVFLLCQLWNDKLTDTTLMMVVCPWMLAVGYSMYMTKKDQDSQNKITADKNLPTG